MREVRKETADRIKNEIAEAAKKEASVRADKTRQEIGDIVVDRMGEYFPEAVQRRRRRNIATGFALGIIVGFLVRHVVGDQ